ncbi:MAG: vancomycin high temperature exclusion protein [Syntrophobacteraceae bacterium]
MKRNNRRILRIVLRASILLTIGVLSCLVGCDLVVSSSGVGLSFDNLDDVPACDVALVLGTARKVSRFQFNEHYKKRIEAAVELFNARKIKYILVSGDNSTMNYNEPAAMKKDLVRQGIPNEIIYCDFAGFRTLDSVVRAKEVFGLQKFIVISQKFHNERAIYIGKHYGVDIYGYNAKDVEFLDNLIIKFREKFARVKCVLDLKLLNSSPKFLGDPIKIGD